MRGAGGTAPFFGSSQTPSTEPLCFGRGCVAVCHASTFDAIAPLLLAALPAALFYAW